MAGAARRGRKKWWLGGAGNYTVSGGCDMLFFYPPLLGSELGKMPPPEVVGGLNLPIVGGQQQAPVAARLNTGNTDSQTKHV